ncbi:fumarate respiration transcriptional regulator DcuR [Klebsiella pneumoniae subsp. rhinoscleromatis]|nr:fumarate respiration transcriptional regulator DcuR [Klebsiella pneumoniae subsp. rhinoscleromatis]
MINVLIVDDDAMVAELNRLYVARVPGFRCSGSASTLSQAQEMINDPQQEIDLVLLDVYMQQDSGLDLLPTIRESGRAIDVIMITSAADAATVQTAMHYGVVDYLIKPFQFPRFEEALTTWREKRKLITGQPYYEQADVDRLLHGGAPEASDARKLPKGLTAQTLRTLCQWIDAHPDVGFSTDELGGGGEYLPRFLPQISDLAGADQYSLYHYPLRRYRAAGLSLPPGRRTVQFA